MMTILHSVDFFPSGTTSVTIEPRQPQSAFPEHHHDFHEIVIVEQGSGIHVFNGQPYTLTSGCVCFIRDKDRHLYEHTENLCLTNILYRSPDAFSFLSGVEKLLPQENSVYAAPHIRVNPRVLQEIKSLIARFEGTSDDAAPHLIAHREMLFMQLLVLLRKAGETDRLGDAEGRLNHLIRWLEEHFAEDICWEELSERFSLSLRTLHRQLRQQTDLTPQRYLNRLRLTRARHLLRHSDENITNIAFLCGFGDSNHFSTLFKREFSHSPRDVRLGRDRRLS